MGYAVEVQNRVKTDVTTIIQGITSNRNSMLFLQVGPNHLK